jgi:sec-independent protein translocase protein TatC
MTLAAHLQEARTRLLRCAVGVMVGVVAGYLLHEQIFELLRAPITALAESRDAALNYDSVTGAFELTMKVSLFAGIVFSSPVWLSQAFAFFVPGLTPRERRYTLGFLAAAVPLFAAGCVTGFTLFPHIVELLASFASADDSTFLLASTYVDFVVKLVVACGIAFVLPVFTVLLNLLGMLPGRTIVRSWRVILVAVVLFSAIATPAADIVSMFLLAVPLTGLFAASALFAVLHDRRVERRLERRLAATDPLH